MSKEECSPKLKFRVVLEALSGEKTLGQIAKQCGNHPYSVGRKKEFLERGVEVSSQDGTVQHCERRLADLEQLLGKKEVEIALLGNFFPQEHRDGVGRNG